MDARSKRILIAASTGHFTVATLHYAMPVLGTWSYGYFGAPSLTRMAEAGSIVPAASALGLAVVFTLFGFVGLSVAGVLRPWRPLRWVLWTLGTIYVLRGLAVISQVRAIAQGHPQPLPYVASSMVALVIGVIQLWGLWSSGHTRRESSRPHPA